MTENQILELYEVHDVPVFNYNDLNLNKRSGREEYLARFLYCKGYSDTCMSVLMAQARHETANFNTLREYGGRKYLSKYDFREDLGNNARGMGLKYRGRGYIQITGYYNYKKVSDAINFDLISNPKLAENPHVAVFIFDWFIRHGNTYKGKNTLEWANLGNMEYSTRCINGGLNGYSERKEYYENYCKKFAC